MGKSSGRLRPLPCAPSSHPGLLQPSPKQSQNILLIAIVCFSKCWCACFFAECWFCLLLLALFLFFVVYSVIAEAAKKPWMARVANRCIWNLPGCILRCDCTRSNKLLFYNPFCIHH
jgi:hypothetical protein